MRMLIPQVIAIALAFSGTSETLFAQNAGTGERLATRWCMPCHAKTRAESKAEKPRSLEAIANTQDVNFDKIVGFLLLPHAVMPNLPLRRKEIEDIAAYIAQLKR